jgi:hypothetical protein
VGPGVEGLGDEFGEAGEFGGEVPVTGEAGAGEAGQGRLGSGQRGAPVLVVVSVVGQLTQ